MSEIASWLGAHFLARSHPRSFARSRCDCWPIEVVRVLESRYHENGVDRVRCSRWPLLPAPHPLLLLPAEQAIVLLALGDVLSRSPQICGVPSNRPPNHA